MKSYYTKRFTEGLKSPPHFKNTQHYCWVFFHFTLVFINLKYYIWSMIAIIVAKSKNNVIGSNGSIPWSVSKDLKYFKELTDSNTVIMGRKTYDSLPENKKPLPNRINIVITKDSNFKANGCIIVNSLEEALLKADNKNDTFIIGGGEIYEQSINFVDKIYITEINGEFDGDTYFPKLSDKWNLVDVVESGECSFMTYSTN